MQHKNVEKVKTRNKSLVIVIEYRSQLRRGRKITLVGIGCERYLGYCNFFKWIDQQLCERAKQIIPGLLKRLNEQTDEKRKLESVIDKLEEMRSIMQSVNERLEVENRALKNEIRALKNENRALKDKYEDDRLMHFVRNDALVV
ncbi:hypothetical protein ACS0TY_002602 [Phlomoides rotata]